MSLTPLTYDILLALADEPRHGYGIIKEIEHRSGTAAAPSTGALYLAIQRMEADGLLEEVPRPSAETDPRRRYYRLTESGREAARDESARMEALVARARAKHLLPQGTQ